MRSVTQLLAATAVLCSVNAAKPKVKTTNPLGSWFGGRIRHVVALMFENRSFDHMLALLRQTDNRTDIDGCLPGDVTNNCYNPIDPSDPNSEKVFVNNEAVWIQPADPDHSIYGTDQQLWGVVNFTESGSEWPAPNNGFIANYIRRNGGEEYGPEIMACFNRSTLPIMSALANDFTLIDRWFAAAPGPTQVNRIFGYMGTSQGMCSNDDLRLIEGFIGPNIFEMLDKYLVDSDGEPVTNNTWKSYFVDAPATLFVEYNRRPKNLKRYHTLPKFFEDSARGELPILSWIDPGYYSITGRHPASDQHPDHDVLAGEELLKRVYESLRHSPLWEETLLVIYYDENGGFFDHVKTPKTVNPDGKYGYNCTAKPSNTDFNFERLGLRVPALLISPWTKKAYVAPRAEFGSVNQYSHSSVIKSLREQFIPQCPSLTKREDVSLSFADLLSEESPRKDCPERLPDLPSEYGSFGEYGSMLHRTLINPSDGSIMYESGKRPVNDLQLILARNIEPLCPGMSRKLNDCLENEDELGRWVTHCMDQITTRANSN